jgi:hypothetical protein
MLPGGSLLVLLLAMCSAQGGIDAPARQHYERGWLPNARAI